MVVYLDAIWLLNFCIDALLIILTGIVLKRDIVKWRIAIGALIGSSIVFLYFTPVAHLLTSPFIKMLFSVCIVFVAFGYRKFRFFFQNLLTFYFVTFLIGGGLVGLHYFFRYESTFVNGVVTTRTNGLGDPVSWAFVLIAFPLLWFFSKQQIHEFEVKKVFYDQIVDVEIEINQTILLMRGLIDSGNQLLDPITKTPVMVIDALKISDQIPESVLKASKGIENFELDESTDHSWSNRFRIVPYRGVGQDHQFLLAIKPDNVKVTYQGEVMNVKKVLIGLNHSSLSSEGDFDCILHPKMLIQANHISA